MKEYLDLTGIVEKAMDLDEEEDREEQEPSFHSDDEEGYGRIRRLSLDHNSYLSPASHPPATELAVILQPNRESSENCNESTRLLEVIIPGSQNDSSSEGAKEHSDKNLDLGVGWQASLARKQCSSHVWPMYVWTV